VTARSEHALKEPGELVVRVHHLRERPASGAAALIIIAALAAAIAWGFGDPLMALVALVVMPLSLGRFFFPVTHTFTGEGFTIESLLCRRTWKWRAFRRCAPCPRGGLFLSPWSAPGKADGTRGVFLNPGRLKAEQVLAYISERLAERRGAGEVRP